MSTTIKLTYRGLEQEAAVVRGKPRGDKHVPMTVYVLAGGARVLPIHFRLGVASISLGQMLKSIYADSYLAALLYEENPFLKMLRKDSSFCGALIPLPISYKTSV